jgi:hypothetical protein
MEKIQCTVFALASAMTLCMPLVTFASDEGLPEDLRTRTISFHLDKSTLQFSKVDGYDSIQIEGLKSFTNPGEPLLPVRSYTLSFEEGSEIVSIRETRIEYWNLSESFTILPTPTPPMWKDPFGRDIKPDETIYNSEEVFPGRHFSHDIGRDGNNVHLFLRVYPVQYAPKVKEISIITDLTIEIQYRAGHSGGSSLQDFSSECVIITPTEFYWQARDLAQIHDSTVGVSTTVVNTTWIDSNYNEAEDPPFPGYSDNLLPGWSSVINYDYSLAKKITAFLNDTSEHPNLSYVLLYGNGTLVPPSYYFYDKYMGGFFDYEAWIPTDFFYGSPDYDLAPNFLVGRLPANTSQTASEINDKISRWYSNLSGNWTKNTVVAGGRPFWSSFYVGELITLDSVNQGFFEGSNLTKMFRSDYRFDREDLLTAFSGEVALTYLISHGSGDGVFLNESMMPTTPDVTVPDILGLEENSNLSVVVSIACDNGAFDNGMSMDPIFSSEMSFGESLIFSRAGAIAYIGGSRSNSGVPGGTLDNGYLNITSENYMADILTRVIRAYSEGAGSLGNITKTALADFVAENDMTDLINKRSLFEFVLLGDPVLPFLPATGTGYLQPEASILDPVFYEDVGDPSPFPGTMPVERPGNDVIMNITTNSPTIGMKIVDLYWDEVVHRGSNLTTDNKSSYTFSSQNTTIYLLRVLSEDGKEGWMYLRICPDPAPPTLRATFLSGIDRANVTISWYKSKDEGLENGTILYRVMRANSLYGPYFEVGNSAAANQTTYNFTDVGMGDGDTNDYFYSVRSVNSDGYYANSTAYAGKMAISLTPGLHLISFPLIQENNSLETVLQTLDFRSVWCYDSWNRVWRSYHISKDYHTLEELNNTMGFWIDVTNSDYLVLAGLIPYITEIHLREGWNLISFPSFWTFYPVLLMKMDTGAERVEGFDPLAPPYHLRVMDDFDDFLPSRGYWVKVPRDVTWTVWVV